MTFWILLAVLTLLSFAFVVPPLLRRSTEEIIEDPHSDAENRRQANVRIYQSRLEELEAANMDAELFKQAKVELDRELLTELDVAEAPQQTARGGLLTVLAVIILIPALSLVLYDQFGQADYSAQAQKQTQPQQTQNQPAPSMAEIVIRIENRLADQPDDKVGWKMLAKSYNMLERHAEANKAYKKAIELYADTVEVDTLTDYAESLALASADEKLGAASGQLLTQAQTINPDDPKTLWLLGLMSMQQNDFEKALKIWQHLTQILPEGSANKQSIERHVSELKIKLGQDVPVEKSVTPTAKNPTTTLSIKVQASPEALADFKPDTTVFIYARAGQGSRMPLAIVKKQLQDLPLTVTLDDSQAMMPTMRLSKFAEVEVLARISPSGQAMTQAGDWISKPQSVKTADQTDVIAITINQMIEE